MTQEQLEAYHEFARKHGVNRGLYLFARIILQPFFLIYFRLSRQGRKNSHIKGATIVAANHRPLRDRGLPALGQADELRGEGGAL